MDGEEKRVRRRLTRRAGVHLSGALAVVLLCAGFAVWAMLDRPAQATVLAVATPLAAGQVITDADVKGVAMNAEDAASLELVPAAHSDVVVGQVAAVPLRVGTLLSVDMVGDPVVPRVGFVEVTVALADGRWPAAVQAGQSVSLLAASEFEASGVWSVPGIVLEVVRPEAGGALVTVELVETAALDLAVVEPSSLLMVATAGGVPPVAVDEAEAGATVSGSGDGGGD